MEEDARRRKSRIRSGIVAGLAMAAQAVVLSTYFNNTLERQPTLAIETPESSLEEGDNIPFSGTAHPVKPGL